MLVRGKMKKKVFWLFLSLVVVLGLLVSCGPTAPAVPTEPTTTPTEPTTTPTEPTTTPTAPAAPGKEMVTVKLKKLDGTIVEKTMEKPRYGGTLITAYTSAADVSGWDDTITTPFEASCNYLGYTMEGLIERDWAQGPSGTGEFSLISTGWWSNPLCMVGQIAESWEFPDATTIIFHVRQGVKWHNKPPANGRELVADDIVFNIRRAYIETKTATMYSMACDSRPTDVYATDNYTVVVKTPPGQLGMTWEYVADWTRYYCPDVIKQYGDSTKWETVTGTGAFILKDFVKGSSTTFVRNPDYYQKDPFFPENQLPYIDKYVLLVIPDMGTREAALRTGKVYLGTAATYERAMSLEKTLAPEMKQIDYGATGYSNMGLRLDNPAQPWYDLNVRRALYMAVDWQQIVKTYFGGYGEVLNYKVMNLPDFKDVCTPIGQLPKSADGFDNNLLYTYHPEEAKALMVAAGYPNGFKFEVIMNNTSTACIDEMTIAKDYWQKNLNVEVNMALREPGAYQAITLGKTHKEGAIVPRWGDQPYACCSCRKGGQYNSAMVDDPKI